MSAGHPAHSAGISIQHLGQLGAEYTFTTNVVAPPGVAGEIDGDVFLVGGGDPLLYAVGSDGGDLGAFRVEGASNYDWEALASFRLQDSAYLLIADVGDSLFAATELTIHERGEFLSPAYYTSMGFSIPAALGAATAQPDHRIVVLVGDGKRGGGHLAVQRRGHGVGEDHLHVAR